MPYYTRLLSPANAVPTADALRDALNEDGRPQTVAVDDGAPEDWAQLTLAHADGSAIAVIERNPVVPGQLGAAEIQEFLEEVEQYKPESAARWLQAYLPRVKCIFAFQILYGADQSDGWGAIDVVRDRLEEVAGGILQADLEGFSNEDGSHILWQFSESVKGLWMMAVLKNERWVTFEMDLGNLEHRAAFMAGEVPTGVQTAPPAAGVD